MGRRASRIILLLLIGGGVLLVYLTEIARKNRTTLAALIGVASSSPEPSDLDLAARRPPEGGRPWPKGDDWKEILSRVDIPEQDPEPLGPIPWRLRNKGIALQGEEDHEGALALFRKALEIQRPEAGEVDPDATWTLIVLAISLDALGRREEAEESLRQALEIRKSALGEGHPDTVTLMGDLGVYCLDHGKRAEGETLLRRALAIKMDLLRSRHPEVLQTREVLDSALPGLALPEEVVRPEEPWPAPRERSGPTRPMGRALALLLEALEDEDPAVRHRATAALKKERKLPAQAAGPLALALRSSDPVVRQHAAWAISRTGGPGRVVVPPLLEASRDKVPEVRDAARSALSHVGPGAKDILPYLMRMAMRDEDALDRQGAAKVLGSIGEEAQVAVPALLWALRDEVAGVRFSACRALGSIGKGAAEAAPALGEALWDPHHHVRREAAFALSDLGEAGVPSLVLAMWEGHTWAPRCLCDANEEAREAVPDLIEMLHTREAAPGGARPRLRGDASMVLNRLGKDAAGAIPSLLRTLVDEEDRVRSFSQTTLFKMRPEDLPFSFLVEALCHKSTHIRAEAAQQLMQMGAKAKEALPALRKALNDLGPSVGGMKEDPTYISRVRLKQAIEAIEGGGE